jgi:glycosyltransferase involved in cell wall biosynthesis
MCADLVRHNENGLLTAVEDAPALADGLIQLHRAGVLGEALIKGGWETVMRYSWQDIARQYYQTLYRPVLERYQR